MPTTVAPVVHDPDQPGLYLVDADTGAIHPVLMNYSFEYLSFSPDGRQLVFAGRAGHAYPQGPPPTQLWVINTDGSDLHQIATDETYTQYPSWSPDGRWIAYYALSNTKNNNATLYLLNTATMTSRRLGLFDLALPPLEWSPNSTRIAIAQPNHRAIAVVDIASGAVTETPVPAEPSGTPLPPGPNANNPPNFLYELGWTNDGIQLVVSNDNGPVALFDASGNFEQILNADAGFGRASPATPMVTEQIDSNTYVQPLHGGLPRLVASGLDPLDWSPDGQLIAAFAPNQYVIASIEPATGQVHPLIDETYSGASAAGWSPIGHVLAVIIDKSPERRY